MAATHIIKCNSGCSPSSDFFSNIYGVAEKDNQLRYKELYRSIPTNDSVSTGSESGSGSGMIMVIVLFTCILFSAVGAGCVYYFQDSIAVALGYKNGADMFGTGSTT